MTIEYKYLADQPQNDYQGSVFTATLGIDTDPTAKVYSNLLVSLKSIKANDIPDGGSVTKTFTIENLSESQMEYNLTLTDVSNTYANGVTYTLTKNNTEVVSSTALPSTNTTILSEQLINSGATDTYVMTISYDSTQAMLEGFMLLSNGVNEFSAKVNAVAIQSVPNIIENLKGVYPTIKSDAVYAPTNNGYRNVIITYSTLSVQKLYKINDGQWQRYNGRGINVTYGDTLYAKGIDKNNNETEVVSYVSAETINAITMEAYDYDLESYMIYHTGYNNIDHTKGYPYNYKYMNIDESMWDGQIQVKWHEWSYSGYYGYIDFLDENGDAIGTKYSISSGATRTDTMNVPNGAVLMRYYESIISDPNWSINGKLYEVLPISVSIESLGSVGSPIFKEKEEYLYPLLKTDGVHAPLDSNHHELVITYSNMSTQKLYKIDDGEWQTYTNPLILNLGQTVYAKGKAANGSETVTNSYTVVTPKAIEGSAYDNDETSGFSTTNTDNILLVDSTMIGKKIKIVNALNDSRYQSYMSYFNANNTQIGSTVRIPNGTTSFVIPANTAYIKYSPYNAWGGLDKILEIYADLTE